MVRQPPLWLGAEFLDTVDVCLAHRVAEPAVITPKCVAETTLHLNVVFRPPSTTSGCRLSTSLSVTFSMHELECVPG